MHSNHHPEHLTYPANKMLPQEEAKRLARWHGKRTKKFIKAEHTRRSRRYLKDQLRDDNVHQAAD